MSEANRGVGALLALALVSTTASAAPRDAPTEIEVDRADTPAGRVELGFDGGAPVPRWGASVVAGWLEEPLVFELSDGTLIEPVRRRQTITAGGAIAIGKAIVADARLATSHQVGDRLIGTGSTRKLDRWVPNDLRIGARIRVAGNERRAALVRGDFSFPIGDQRDFAGDPSWTLAWRLIGRLTLRYDIVVAGTVGLRIRGEEIIVGDRLVGNEFLGAAGIAVPIPPIRPLWCGGDQVKVTAEIVGVLGDNVGAGRGPSPVEARLGVVIKPVPQLAIGIRAGTGLTDEIGAPAGRVSLELAWQP